MSIQQLLNSSNIGISPSEAVQRAALTFNNSCKIRPFTVERLYSPKSKDNFRDTCLNIYLHYYLKKEEKLEANPETQIAASNANAWKMMARYMGVQFNDGEDGNPLCDPDLHTPIVIRDIQHGELQAAALVSEIENNELTTILNPILGAEPYLTLQFVASYPRNLNGQNFRGAGISAIVDALFLCGGKYKSLRFEIDERSRGFWKKFIDIDETQQYAGIPANQFPRIISQYGFSLPKQY